MESPRKHGASERRQRRVGATDSTAEQGPEATRSSSSSLEADGRAIARRPEGVRGARSPAWNLERGPSQGERRRSRASGVHGSNSAEPKGEARPGRDGEGEHRATSQGVSRDGIASAPSRDRADRGGRSKLYSGTACRPTRRRGRSRRSRDADRAE